MSRWTCWNIQGTARPRGYCGLPKYHGKKNILVVWILFILTGLALQYGESALVCVSSAGETECVKVLVKYGAQVDLPVRCDVQKWIQGCGVLCGWAVFDIYIAWGGSINHTPSYMCRSFLISHSTPWRGITITCVYPLWPGTFCTLGLSVCSQTHAG